MTPVSQHRSLSYCTAVHSLAGTGETEAVLAEFC